MRYDVNMEKRLIKDYQETEDKKILGELLNIYKPVVVNKVYKYKSNDNVNFDTIKNRATILTAKAIKNYNPKFGTKPITYITNQLKPISRFVSAHTNTGKIPEERIQKISMYKNAVNELEEDLGREPSALEIGERIHWPLAEVERMRKELGRDELTEDSSFEYSVIDPDDIKMSETVQWLYYELDPREQKIYEYSTGLFGSKVLSGKQTAKKMGISEALVTKVKKKIREKLREYGY